MTATASRLRMTATASRLRMTADAPRYLVAGWARAWQRCRRQDAVQPHVVRELTIVVAEVERVAEDHIRARHVARRTYRDLLRELRVIELLERLAQNANDALSLVTSISFGHFALTESAVAESVCAPVAFIAPNVLQKK
jgi:hypothetical protein